MQDLLLVGPALRLSDFLDLCRAQTPGDAPSPGTPAGARANLRG